jgi:hypothetical protein
MKDLIKTDNILIQECEPSDFDRWVKEEFKGEHPISLVKATFSENVMKAVCSDHHKSRDGGFVISYDHWTKKWYVSHEGYVREAEASGDSYSEAAREYLDKIHRENEKVLYGKIEDQASRHLPEDISLEIGDRHMGIYRYREGQDRICVVGTYDIEGKTLEQVIAKANELLNDYLEAK